MTTNTKKEDWEKEFDKLFAKNLSLGTEPFNDTYVEFHIKPLLKQFISNKITHQRQQAVAEFAGEVINSIDEIADGQYGMAIYSWTPTDYIKHIHTLLEKRNIHP